MTSPNIILIILDALRADRVLVNYKDKKLTPFIEKLLDNSICFENCIANYTWTVPSHISMFTGLYQSQNELISKDLEKISIRIPVLTEILKDMGFFTICFTENPYFLKPCGLTRGFDIVFKRIKGTMHLVEKWIEKTSKIFQFTYILIFFLHFMDSKLKKRIKSNAILRFWWIFKNKFENLNKKILQKLFWKDILFNKYNPIKNLEEFSQILKKNINKKPFYLFFNIMATHNPYIPTKEILKSFKITIRDFKMVKDFLLNPVNYIIDMNIFSNRLSEEKIEIIKKLYDTCVFYSDFLVKKLFSILENLGLLDNSYVLITSDHGESLCDRADYYLWSHGVFKSVYESLIRVPLSIYNPNFQKRIVKKQVELKDLFHTILHLTGNTGDKNKYLDIRKSILYQIDNDSTPNYIFGEHLNLKERTIAKINKYWKNVEISKELNLNNKIYSLRSDSHKYIRFNNEIEEFYDLLNDPHEQFNIIDENNENYRKMKLYIDDFIKKTNNINELEDIITKKEKDLLKKSIHNIF